jgi:hypothetical protein
MSLKKMRRGPEVHSPVGKRQDELQQVYLKGIERVRILL